MTRQPTPSDRGHGAVKAVVRWFFLLLVAWRIVVMRITALAVGKDRAFSSASESIGRIPGLRGDYLRQAFYGTVLPSCGGQVRFGWQTVFSKRDAILGDGVYLGRHCSLGLVAIGSDAMLADGVQVLSGGQQHGFDPADSRPYKDQPQVFSRVEIGANAWIGTNAIIMADVGESAVVAAGAVVTRPIPPRAVAMGVPARVQRMLD